MVATTLVTGPTASAREDAVAAAMDPECATAVILEGLPDKAADPDPFVNHPALKIIRIAPGCPCCSGDLTMRVMLNRLLRHPPARLFIGLASRSHLDHIREFLEKPPYDRYICLTDDIRL